MIRPPGEGGVVFTEASDGNIRDDVEAKSALSNSLQISSEWATIKQVHGVAVLRVDRPGLAGEADALWTTEPKLPVAVFTADCFGVVLRSAGAVGVAHAGWRGARSGVVSALLNEMSRGGHSVLTASIGPGIGACCFEVGPEVSSQFEHSMTTTWGTPSVDIRGVVSEQLGEIETNSIERCTRHDPGFFSHRMNATTDRMTSVGWIG